MSESITGLFASLRRASALVGAAVTTTITTTGLPINTTFVNLHSRNYSTAVAIGITLNPYLAVVKTQDTGATFTDYSRNAQDADTATVVTLDSQDTIANGDALYIGTHVPFAGCTVIVGAANATASRTLTVRYWDGTLWTDISDADGTSSSTSLDQSGNVTWTVPSAWVAERLEQIRGTDRPVAAGVLNKYFNSKLYWTRWEWNGALDSEVEIDELHAINEFTLYYPMAENETLSFEIHNDVGGVGSIQHVTDANTGNLMIGVGVRTGHFG